MKACTDLTASGKQVSGRLYLSKNEIVVNHLPFSTQPRKQQYSASFRKTVRRYTALFQVQNSHELAKPNLRTRSSPRHPDLAPVTIGILHQDLSRRSIPYTFIVSLAYMTLCSLHVDNGTARRSVLLRLQFVFRAKSCMHGLQKLSKRLSTPRTEVLQTLQNIP